MSGAVAELCRNAEYYRIERLSSLNRHFRRRQMPAVLQHAELIRFAAMAILLTLSLLLGRIVTRLVPAGRGRSQPRRSNGSPTRPSSPGEGSGRALIRAMMMGQPKWK